MPSLSALNACPGLVGGSYMYPKWNLLQMFGDLYVEQYGTTFLSGISSPLPHPQTSQYPLDLFPLPSPPSHTLLVLFLIGDLPLGKRQGSPASIIAVSRPGLEVARGRAVEKALTRSDEDGSLGVQAADWVHTYRDSQAGLCSSPGTCPSHPNPEAGCRESLHWMSRWGSTGSRRPGLGTAGRDTGRWLSRSRNAQPCGRDPCPPRPAVWTCCGGRGCSLRCSRCCV